MRAQRDAQALGALLAEMRGCLPAHTELPPDLCSDVLLMPLPSKRPPPPHPHPPPFALPLVPTLSSATHVAAMQRCASA